MDAFDAFWYFFLIVLYFFLSTLLGAKKQQQRRPAKTPPVQKQQQKQEQQPVPQVSFEELLQELDQKIKNRTPLSSQEETIAQRKKYRETTLERSFSWDDKYEEPQNQPPPSSSKSQLTSPVQSDGSGKFEPFQEKQPEFHPVLKLFSNPEQVRNAFIVSEIFKRKW
ncbi:MAG: hypothetical protein RMJ44_10740 [Cytophagales bacterium]|nr:hypothetical protein [Bernardetiaceae bacterium]MDW8211551.1 hypothetical protein [Cytophagales bacterium]